MLNINILIKKFNKLLISINKLIESFFINLDNFIKSLKKKNSISEKINNRVFVSFGILVILVLFYFLIPSFYDKNLVKIKLENQIKNKYNLKVNFLDNVSYAIFPKPHFYANDLNIFQGNDFLINSKNVKIYISPKNFFNSEKLKIENIIFQKNEFNIKNRNLSFFKKLLNSNKSEHNINFKDSIIFFKDNFEDVLFLINLKDLILYYDLENQNQLKSKFEIFNLPFMFDLNHNENDSLVTSILKSKKIRLNIENDFKYSDKKINGNLNFQVINKVKSLTYNIENHYVSFKSNDESLNGKIDIKPFFLSLSLNLDSINTKRIFNEKSILVNLIRSEIFNNQSINAEVKIILKKLRNYNFFENIFVRIFFEEGYITIKDLSSDWNDSVKINIFETQLLNEGDKLSLVGSVSFNFSNLDKFYRYYQISSKYRKKIKKIESNFVLDINEKKFEMSNIKIDNITNDNLNNFVEIYNSQSKNFLNKVIFRNFVKSFFENY